MNIERYNWSSTQCFGVGTKLKHPLEKETHFSVSESAIPIGRDSGIFESYAPLSRTNVYHTIIPQIGVGAEAITSPACAEWPAPEDDTTGALIAKVEKLANLLKQKGIKGQIAMSVLEAAPQKYAAHYVDVAGGNNIVIYEMEDGRLLFAETDLGPKEFFDSFDHARTALGLNDGKLSIEELRKIFASFMGVDRLKDFLLEYLESDNKYSKYFQE